MVRFVLEGGIGHPCLSTPIKSSFPAKANDLKAQDLMVQGFVTGNHGDSCRASPDRQDPLPRFGDRRRIRIGLLGGSFNPAHAGHRHIARLALRRLKLDQVWLLVSPGNPLKPSRGMAPFVERLASANSIADGRRIVASGLEAALNTRYTVDTLRLLVRRFPAARFVWIMGADILEQLPRWRRWRDIARVMPFAVLPRPGYNDRALTSQAACRLRSRRRPASQAALLPGTAPGWSFLPGRQNPISATMIRLAAEGNVS